MPHVLPPYRADVVGSFLRPAAVAQARAAFARGELSREALTAVEDEEIAALVKKELDNGLTAVTDGEFRRAFWHRQRKERCGGNGIPFPAVHNRLFP